MTNTNYIQTVCLCGKPIDLQTAEKDAYGVFRCSECIPPKDEQLLKIKPIMLTEEQMKLLYNNGKSIMDFETENPCLSCGFNWDYTITKERLKEAEAVIDYILKKHARYHEIKFPLGIAAITYAMECEEYREKYPKEG